MDANYINKQLQAIEKAAAWVKNVPAAERLEYKKKLINFRRGLKKILFAVSEPCSTAAFGESQMGKSYLVSAMLSTPDCPFSVTDGKKSYNFIEDINPSRPNSKVEATGVITRFTSHKSGAAPEGHLKLRLLSVADIAIILCETYYIQVNYSQEGMLTTDEINEAVDNIVPEKPSEPQRLVTQDDILDIKEYMAGSSEISKRCDKVTASKLFNFLVENADSLSEAQMADTLELLWNRQPQINRLWKDMLAASKKLGYNQVVYTRFDSVLKRKGTLLDVARLDEMYGEPEDAGSEYEPMTEVMTSAGGEAVRIEKSFLSALIAELSFGLPAETADTHTFLKDLDILDFPGARPPRHLDEELLANPKDLSLVLRRGKVSYLFNKYSAAKRISTLMFCQNNEQNTVSIMSELLDKWVAENVGTDAKQREEYMKTSVIAPMFMIGTYFNRDLEYHNEREGDHDTLNSRWNRRFGRVLENEVLESKDKEGHWFNSWSKSVPPFQNIYMLRDFKFSDMIYHGYNPLTGYPETGEPVSPDSYPAFFNDLRQSFVTNDFVKLHFADPAGAWDDAASCAKDGTGRIIQSLNVIAPNVAKARDDKFSADVKRMVNGLSAFLEQYYHPDSSDEQLKIAKRQAGAACMQVDRMIGHDPYSFGRLMDAMMISESEVYELVNSLILGDEQPTPMSDEEAQIFMSAGMDSSLSREENIERLCDYLGVNDEDECREALDGINLDNLLEKSQMMTGRADNMVAAVEELWRDKVLMGRAVSRFELQLPAVSTVVSSLLAVYKLLGVSNTLAEKVNYFVTNIDKEVSVGIISDYLSMQLNDFTSSFGYTFFSEEQKRKLRKKNAELKLNLNEELLDGEKPACGIDLLTDLYKQKELLSGNAFVGRDKAFLARFPQFRKVWRWQQQLRAGYIFASELPDYDVKANAEMKTILDTVRL